MDELYIPFDQVVEELQKVLQKYGMEESRAKRCATLFAKADLDGVHSHGVNRFFTFLEYIRNDWVKLDREPEPLSQLGVFERWDGLYGVGNLNAEFAMGRAIELSKEFGIGCVALKNTNHWMRAGNFGWQAVEAGCIGICFTNTMANMAAWGGNEPKVGNNPLVIAIPREEGPVVLDMAMSQFAYGKMSIAKSKDEQMPFVAGFDDKGNMTTDPGTVIKNHLALPAGLWKGSGLSLMIDMLATLLSDGNATHEVDDMGTEIGLSQVFISLDPNKLELIEWMGQKADEIINDLKSSSSFDGKTVRYPGEQSLETRNRNLKNGVPIAQSLWEKIQNEAN